MTRDDLPLPLQRPALPDDDPVAVLAREVGRRAAEAAKAQAREKAQRRAARKAQAPGRLPAQPPAGDRAEAAPAPGDLTRSPRPATTERAGTAPASAMAAAPALAIDTPGEARPAAGRRRASSARRQSARRARRRRRTWLAATVLGAVSVLAVSGLYQLLGRAPAPLPNEAWAIASGDRGTPGPAPMPRAAAPAPTALPAPSARPPQAAPAVAAAPTAAPAPPAPTAGPAPPRVTAAGRGAAAVLPYIPGSQVVESDAEPQQAPGGGTTWAATITSQGPVDKAAAYYRQLLSADARPGGATLTEVTPGPGQLLLSLGNPGDGSHSAVWIGQSDGQVLIRLMRTQGPAPTP